VSECDREVSIIRRSWPSMGLLSYDRIIGGRGSAVVGNVLDIRGSNPIRSKRFFSFSNYIPPLEPTQPAAEWILALILRG